MSELVEQIVLALQPILIETVTTAVTSAVAEVTKQIVQLRSSESSETRNNLNKLKIEAQRNKFELDRLEQYSRKGNITIQGLLETPAEDHQ